MLAIGVDNVFLLTWAFDEARPQTSATKLADPSSRDSVSGAADGSRALQPSSEEEGRGGGGLTDERGAGGRSETEMEVGVTMEGLERSMRAVASVGPSVVCAAAAECGAFLLGATTGMPAVISFSRFAAFAVAVDVFIQLTLFPAILALTFSMRSQQRAPPHEEAPDHSATSEQASQEGEQSGGAARNGGAGAFAETAVARAGRRQVSGRLDGLEERLLDGDALDSEIEEEIQTGDGSEEPQEGGDGGSGTAARDASAGAEQGGERGEEGWRSLWEARVMSDDGKVWVLVFAIVLMIWSLLASSRVERGLEQTDALPSDSFLIPYFNDLANLVQVGPPVFFVVKGAGEALEKDVSSEAKACNFSQPEDLMKLCTRRGCRRDSLGNSISNAARFTNYTYIATGASNVVDDLVGWLSASLDSPMVMCFCTPQTFRLLLNFEGCVCTPACACVNLGGFESRRVCEGRRL